MSRVTVSQMRPDLVPRPVPVPLITEERFAITDAQRYAILLARAGELAGKLKPIMQAMGWPQPTRNDWADLVRQGYVILDTRDPRYHTILPRGLTLAHAVMRDLARKFGVHHVTFQPGSSASGHKATCTCGFIDIQPWTRGGLFAVRASAGEHLRQAEHGTLPPAYQIGPAGVVPRSPAGAASPDFERTPAPGEAAVLSPASGANGPAPVDGAASRNPPPGDPHHHREAAPLLSGRLYCPKEVA